MKRKILSLLLSLSLCLSLFPTALAEGEDEDYLHPYPYQTRDPDTRLWGLSNFVEGVGPVTVLPAEYDYVSGFTGDYATVKKDGLWGMVDYEGNFIFPVEYNSLHISEEGIVTAAKDGQHRYFRTNGTSITDFAFTECEDFYRIGVGKREIGGRELYGAVNAQGETVIPFEYDYLSAPPPSYSSLQFILAEKDGCSGAFDPSGNLLRRCIYSTDDIMQQSLALPAQMTEEEELSALIASSQTWEVEQVPGSDLWGYRFRHSPSGMAYMDWAIRPIYTSAQPFDETGHAQVTNQDGRMGTIDQSGNFTPAPLNDRFSDVLAGIWYDRGVTTCAEKGVMVGTGEGLFSPNARLSAAECLTLALRLYDLQRGGDGTLEKAPADLPPDDLLPGPDKWYRDAIYTARQWGLEEADGFSSLLNSFYYSDNGWTDREKFALALSVAAGELEKKYTVERIPDMERREKSARLYELYEAGILNGTDAFGTFQPEKTLTRAEAATMVARVLDPAQRLSSPPAIPDAYDQAVIDLRTSFGYHNEQTFETPDCTIFVYDSSGIMLSHTGVIKLIYKPGSALGAGTVVDPPHARVQIPVVAYPADTMALSEDQKTFTYTYYRTEDIVYEGEVLEKAGTVTYTVDLPTGTVTESFRLPDYAGAMAHVTRKRIKTPGESSEDREVVWTQDAEDCTVVLTKGRYVELYDDYILSLVYKPGSELGEGTVKRLLLPSTVYASGYSRNPTDRAPDSWQFGEDGKTFTYRYHFSEPLTVDDTVYHEAGTYVYTADLTTGEVTAYIDPASQQSLAYYGILGSLYTEEGYEQDYTYLHLPDGVNTVLRSRPCPGDPEKRDYEFYLIRKEAQPQLLRLPLPSTELLPDGSAPTTQRPETLQFEYEGTILTYTYRFQEPLWDGNTLLHDKGTYVYTVDVITGEQSVVLEDSYEYALAEAIEVGGTWRVDQQLETPLCTILAQHSEGGGGLFPGACITLIFKDGSPNGAGETIDLPNIKRGKSMYSSIPPHSIFLNEDKTVLTYIYQFDEDQYAVDKSLNYNLTYKAGTYTTTVDLSTGTANEVFAPKE